MDDRAKSKYFRTLNRVYVICVFCRSFLMYSSFFFAERWRYLLFITCFGCFCVISLPRLWYKDDQNDINQGKVTNSKLRSYNK